MKGGEGISDVRRVELALAYLRMVVHLDDLEELPDQHQIQESGVELQIVQMSRRIEQVSASQSLAETQENCVCIQFAVFVEVAPILIRDLNEAVEKVLDARRTCAFDYAEQMLFGFETLINE